MLPEIYRLALPPLLNAADIAKRAKEEENVILAPGPIFGVAGDDMVGELLRGAKDELVHGVRLCFTWEDERVLEEGVERLGAVFRKSLSERKNDYDVG